jgi:flagellar basal body rod protein FlgC
LYVWPGLTVVSLQVRRFPPITAVMITPAASAATYGMAAAAQRFDVSAQNVATASTGAAGTPDVATELVSARVTAPAAYAANAQMFRAADATRGSLLDILA